MTRAPERPSAGTEADKIDGLTADLRMAVQVAYRRGAREWARLNYPQWIDWLASCDAVDGPSVGTEGRSPVVRQNEAEQALREFGSALDQIMEWRDAPDVVASIVRTFRDRLAALHPAKGGGET